MTDQLAARFICTINGKQYNSGPAPEAPGQPVSLEIEHRDNESSRMIVKVWDLVKNPNVDPFPEFNSMPNPRCNENIPAEAWAGWEDGPLVKMFSGILLGKRFRYQTAMTEFACVHRVFKLRKRGKVDTLKNITVAQLLKKKPLRRASRSRLINLLLAMTTSTCQHNGLFNWASPIGA